MASMDLSNDEETQNLIQKENNLNATSMDVNTACNYDSIGHRNIELINIHHIENTNHSREDVKLGSISKLGNFDDIQATSTESLNISSLEKPSND
eukprot:gene3202-3678_t